MIKNDELLKIGSITKTHGLDGEVNVLLDYDLVPGDFDRVAIEIDGIYVPFYIESSRPKGQAVMLLKFDGIDNADAAGELCGLPVYVFQKDNVVDSDLDDGEFYLADLVGFVVEDESGKEIGCITDIDDSTENALFIVETSGGKEMMIPVVDDFIESVDSQAKILVMALPAGLLDLN